MFPLFLARTHVNYEVKDDVAVVRMNAPNSKVRRMEHLHQPGVSGPDWRFHPPGQHTVHPNAKGDDRGDGWSVG